MSVPMEDAHRWTATYTNHVKPKRKVYHDGFLVFQPSRQKVMLYDEWEKLLDTRFVKKDDVIKSGETVTFDSHLVDIGELCRGHQSASVFNCPQEKEMKTSENSGTYCTLPGYNSQNRRPVLGKSKGRATNLSPSHKMIKDFKKSEINKFCASPNFMDMTNACTREWPVLYTTQVTQKAKKFHDGFLELIVHGLQGRQVKLYDSNRRHLDSRFLKKDEIVCSGESLAFEGHLVEIGGHETENKPPTDLAYQGKNCEVVENTCTADPQAKTQTYKIFPAGKIPGSSSQDRLSNFKDVHSNIQNAKLRSAEPRRAVHDILSILKQPIEKKVVPVIKPLADELYSSDTQSKECSRTEELREKTCDQERRDKVEPEVVEVVIPVGGSTVIETGRGSQARSSSSCLRSETTNTIAPNELLSNSSPVKSNMTSYFEEQMPIESATLTRSNENEELENPTLMCLREEIMTVTNAATPKLLSSSKLPKLWEDLTGSNTRCQEAAPHVNTVASSICTSRDLSGDEEKTANKEFHAKELDWFPSFDLGI